MSNGRQGCICLILLLILVACGGATPTPLPATEPPLGPLYRLLPDGLRLVVIARPDEIVARDALRTVAMAILEDERLDRFSARTGVDPRAIRELVLGVGEDGRVVLARGPFDAPFVVMEAGARMAPIESEVDEPFVRRAGFIGDRRVDLAAPASDALMWVDGTPQLAASVLRRGRRDADRSASALDEGLARAVRRASGSAPFVLIAPRPLGLPADSGIGLLLAREEAMAVWASPAGDDALELQMEMRGEFPPGATANFRALAESLAASDLGASVGAVEALETLELDVDRERVRARCRVRAAVLAAGLRVLLSADMEEMIEGARREEISDPRGD